MDCELFTCSNTKEWTVTAHPAYCSIAYTEDGGSTFSETSALSYKSTQRHNPEDLHRYPHRRENLKSRVKQNIKLIKLLHVLVKEASEKNCIFCGVI
jgi:hypothetical protein